MNDETSRPVIAESLPWGRWTRQDPEHARALLLAGTETLAVFEVAR